MDWKKEAINDLRLYGQRKQFLDNVDNQMLYLKNDFTSLKGCVTDSAAVEGGTSKSEDHIINNIVKRDKLMRNKEYSEMFVKTIDNALNCLTNKQKYILLEFYADRTYGHIERLMERLHVEQTRVYQLKNEALYNFTILMYGVSDS